MTFDEAIARVGTYLKNNDLSNSENNDKFFYIILNGLQQEYAPTVEMTSGQAKTIMDEKYKNNLTGLLNGGSYWFDVMFWEPLTEKQVAQSWLHQETIKIVDE